MSLGVPSSTYDRHAWEFLVDITLMLSTRRSLAGSLACSRTKHGSRNVSPINDAMMASMRGFPGPRRSVRARLTVVDCGGNGDLWKRRAACSVKLVLMVSSTSDHHLSGKTYYGASVTPRAEEHTQTLTRISMPQGLLDIEEPVTSRNIVIFDMRGLRTTNAEACGDLRVDDAPSL